MNLNIFIIIIIYRMILKRITNLLIKNNKTMKSNMH